MEPEKIRSPKTGRYIDVYGPAYNKLLKNGYTNEQLLKQYKIPSVTKNKKILSIYKQKQDYLQTLQLPDEILFEEVIMQMDSPDFMSICQSNKKFLNLCQDEKFWEKMYYKHYGSSEMRELLSDMSFSELFKICYGLTLLNTKMFKNKETIKELYTEWDVIVFPNILPFRYNSGYDVLKLMRFMHNLQKIIFKVKNITDTPPILPPELNNLPFLTEVKVEKL